MQRPRPDHLGERARGVRILLVDNFSSFTQNLVHDITRVTGIAPTVVANTAPQPDLGGIHGIVISPGPGSPDVPTDLGIGRALLLQDAVPVLGVCLGHQAIGALSGATVNRADEPFHGRVSTIIHEGDELFAGVPQRFGATRYHSLIVRAPLPSELRCIARTELGDVMALRHERRPQWGVQFHPESIASEYGRLIVENFCVMARQRRPGPALAALSREAPVASLVKPERRWVASTRTVHGVRGDSVFAALYADSASAFWLDGSAEDGALSYLGDASGPDSYQLSFDVVARSVQFRGAKVGQEACDDIFALLRTLLEREEAADVPGLDFVGGMVGYFGYETKACLGAKGHHEWEHPDAQWTFATRFVAVDEGSGRGTLVALRPAGTPDDECRCWLEESAERLARPATPTEANWPAPEVRWRDQPDGYRELIRACQEEILAGESYELCLTTQLECAARVDAIALFRRMRSSNPAPYSAFLRCEGFSVASSSPERFLKVSADGLAESKPIKGTAPRGRTSSEDAKFSEELFGSEKERAENLMIVDLVRHDLSKVCEVGSVVVPKNAVVESYATVHQLVSTVEGRLRTGESALSCVAAAFPGGSMTGAPKQRSMEILERLETGPRGIYSGSIGYLSTSGAANLSIVIRSAVVEPERVLLGVGGAITALSDPDAEVREVELKARAQLRALGV